MSHILFGSCTINHEKLEEIKRVKKYMLKFGIKLWFDNEIDFYNDVQMMITEQNNSNYNHIFCLTSNKQPTNSDDLIFPYEKYMNGELFPNGEDRSKFNEYCQRNLIELRNCLIYFMDIVSPQNVRFFLTEGYDNQFKYFNCSVDEMINHILQQVKKSHFLDSVIYIIN